MTSRNADGKPLRDTCKAHATTVDMAVCDNCGHRCPADDLDGYKDFWSRVTVGGIVPAGDCPKCGAFAYVEDETRRNHEAYAGLVSALKRAHQEHERGSQVCARQIVADALRAVGEEV
jgi:predicted RNA-binding Zn-ribbon protein involved in translation (DUF1610 family)